MLQISRARILLLAACACIVVVQKDLPAQGRPGALAGLVLLPDGAPAVGVRVAAASVDPAGGRASDGALVSIALTNDSGQYLLEDIPPGEYYVVAGLLEWLTYFPGVTDSGVAKPVPVVAGSRTSGIDFMLQRPNGARVSGRLSAAHPSIVLPDTVRLLRSGVSQPLQSRVAPVRDGAFEFLGVAPGVYQLQLHGSVMQAVEVAVVDGDVEGIEVRIPLTRRISGRAVVEDRSPMPRLALNFVSDGGSFSASINPGGVFSLVLPEGEHEVQVGGLAYGYAVQSVERVSTNLPDQILRVDGVDVPDVVVTLTPPQATTWFKVSGRVIHPSSNVSEPPARVVLTVQGDSPLHNLEAPVGPDGSFEFPQVLPGAYWAQVQPLRFARYALDLNVAGDIAALDFVMPREFEVRGRVVIEDNGSIPLLTIKTAGLYSVGPREWENLLRAGILADASPESAPPVTSVESVTSLPDGTFRLTLPEGEHRVTVEGIPTGYFLKSMTSGQNDILAGPLVAVGDAEVLEILITIGR